MIRENHAHLEGTVKRDAEAKETRHGTRVMDFCLVVPTGTDKDVYVDCFAENGVLDALEGFVEEGERLAVEGHITFRTHTQDRLRRSAYQFYVEEVTELDE